jgi:hypothetical protein
MMVLDRSTTPRRTDFAWKNGAVIDCMSKRKRQHASARDRLQNPWTKMSAGPTARSLKATIPQRDVLMLWLRKAR